MEFDNENKNADTSFAWLMWVCFILGLSFVIWGMA